MMQRNRLESFVEASWGSAAVFSTEPEVPSNSSLVATVSEVMKAMSTMQAVVEEESLHTRSNSPRKCLSFLTSALFATAMEDALITLRILMQCNNELRIMKATLDMSKLLSVKFNVKQIPSTDELEGIDPDNLECEKYKINKLEADRNYIIETFLATYIDLCISRSYGALEVAIDKIIDRDNYRVAVQEEEFKNALLSRELHKQLRHRRNHIKSVIYENNQKIEELQAQLEDSGLFTNCRSRYIDKWQVARTEQHIQTIHDVDIITARVVEEYKRRTEHEQRVHAEIDLLSNIIITETLDRIDDWMSKYDKDIEKIDVKIRIKKNEFQTMEDKRIALEKTIEDHDVKMKEWCEFKDIREKARLYREKMTKSAITVQSWWRGLLVRRQLGPYKVAKGQKRRK